MINIAVIGAGELGSRHLQALVKLPGDGIIQVVDPKNNSLEVARQRIEQVSSSFTGTITFLNNISELADELDIVIVATNSNVRKNVIVEVLTCKKVNYLILEKFLFPRIEEYQIVADLLVKCKTIAWVNCPRRMLDFYNELKKTLNGNIHIAVTGNGWGLGCNGIHLLDLMAYLTGTPDFKFDNSMLDDTTISSKRPGYIEFTGTLTGSCKNGTIHFTSFAKGISPTIMTISDECNRYEIVEAAITTVRKATFEREWNWEYFTFDFPYQSQLTNLIAADLLKTGSCMLTPYAEASTLHISILRAFMEHLNKNNLFVKECLIT